MGKISLKDGYFDEPKTKKLLWKLLWGACGVSLLAEMFLHRHSHFSEHGIDGKFGFFAGLAFVACLVCVLIAKLVGGFLKVKEDYYRHDLS